MSKFITNELDTIDCGDDEWVKIPKELSVEDGEKVTAAMSEGGTPIKVFLVFVREWNFKDNNGQIPPITEENVKKLNMATLQIILTAINKRIEPLKKKLPKSNGQSTGTEEVASTPTL